MSRLPLYPPAQQGETEHVVANFQPLERPDFYIPADKDYVERDFENWKVQVVTSLANAVPANVDKTTITIHRHQIIVERKDNLYKVVSTVENILLVASSALLVGVSGAAVMFAVSVISAMNGN